MKASLRTVLIGWISAALMLIGFPAQAGMIGTEGMLAAQARDANLTTVNAFMARDQVQQQLESWGVESALAADRVGQLSDVELQELAMNIESQPAGGSAIGVIGVVFLILLILELVGITDIFKAI